jgi:amino acid transporter
MPSVQSGDRARPESRFGHFLARHGRELKVLAQVGCVLCVIRGGAALFRLDRPNDRTLVALIFGFVALYYCAGAAADPLSNDGHAWLKVPPWLRHLFKPGLIVCGTVMIAVAFLTMFTGRPSGAAYHIVVTAAGSGFFALLYALEALYFLRKDPEIGPQEQEADPSLRSG